jgi:O-antigen ligase
MRASRFGLLIAILSVPLFATAVYFTYTRSVWLGAALAGTLVLALTLHGRWRPVVLAGVAAVALLAVVTQWDSLVAFRREDSAAVTRESTYMRASFAYVSLKMFQDRPLWGVGFGQFPRENRVYLSDRSSDLHLESIRGYVHHNTPLCILVEMGLLGLIAYVAFLAAWARNGWRLWKCRGQPTWARAHGLILLAALVCYTAQMVFHDVTYSPIDNTLLYLLAGLASGLLGAKPVDHHDAFPSATRRRADDVAPEHSDMSDLHA